MQGRAAQAVLQLTHVAEPGVVAQQALRRRRQAQIAQSEARTVVLKEGAGQRQQIRTPAFTQRWYPERIDAQAVIEVFTEMPGGDLRLEIAIGGRDDTHIDPDYAIAAQRLQLALLQDPKQLGLQRQRQLADLIQQQGAAIRHHEVATVIMGRAREGATPMPEQRAFDQVRRQGGAVDAHQRTRSPPGSIVQPLDHALLAHAGLALHQHRHLGIGDRLQLRLEPGHRRATLRTGHGAL